MRNISLFGLLFLSFIFANVTAQIPYDFDWTREDSVLYSKYPETDKVGIGTNNPAFLLSLGSTTARTKLALYETGIDNSYGLGVVPGIFRFHLKVSLSKRTVRYDSVCTVLHS